MTFATASWSMKRLVATTASLRLSSTLARCCVSKPAFPSFAEAQNIFAQARAYGVGFSNKDCFKSRSVRSTNSSIIGSSSTSLTTVCPKLASPSQDVPILIKFNPGLLRSCPSLSKISEAEAESLICEVTTSGGVCHSFRISALTTHRGVPPRVAPRGDQRPPPPATNAERHRKKAKHRTHQLLDFRKDAIGKNWTIQNWAIPGFWASKTDCSNTSSIFRLSKYVSQTQSLNIWLVHVLISVTWKGIWLMYINVSYRLVSWYPNCLRGGPTLIRSKHYTRPAGAGTLHPTAGKWDVRIHRGQVGRNWVKNVK